ncbi:core-2/I-Branching enzyme [Dysgonomonas alginatilytica]|uniref:Peptide O-xylosyltransferase n=1 Tax=Dysgonomonas alginatilytica TaxID=1605892 RepID=A0A2V3PMJ5_9BACT|nr:beta-1,6-N-acetylglucosaminyltransferase [Dysgonomonas alginatilytica]PXV62098.1 core-2/I-Branching enzyme [Dysgonomonas alginatilytica]
MQAILITAYKNYHHLEELVNFFDDRFNIYIHIDKKSSISPKDIQKLSALKKVQYLSQQYKINWGGINHLKAILELTKEAIKNKENKYFHLITGHDYPIKSLDEFTKFLEINKDKDFMEYHLLPYSAWPENGMDRLSRYNMYDLLDGRTGLNERLIKGFSKFQKVIGFKRNFSKDFPLLYGGSTYWSLKRESIEYVFQYMSDHPKYLTRFKYSFCSEEIFFQTILLNSPMKESIINNNMRFIIWEERNGNFPANLDNSDYKNITASDALFARKFEYPVSESLLDNIKADINKR